MRSQMSITNAMSCSISRMVSPNSRAQLHDQLAQRLLLRRVHARGGLVEQQEPRPRRERARDLEPALLAVGQRVGARVGEALEAEPRQQRRARCARARASRRAPARRRAARRARRERPRADQRRAHVVEHGERAEQADVLERARDAAPRRSGAAGSPPMLAARRSARARGRRVDARDHVEGGRLAGAVRADQRDERARVDARGRARDRRRAPPKRTVDAARARAAACDALPTPRSAAQPVRQEPSASSRDRAGPAAARASSTISSSE